MAGENWTFWLNMTNFALGIITLLALVVVFGAVGRDLLVLKVHNARKVGSRDLNMKVQIRNLGSELCRAHF